MSYYLARSLAQLRAQIDAAWPHRSKSSDGWIGDTRHSALVSDHNPDYTSGGVVRAIDVTSSGINFNTVAKTLRGDSRTSYYIHKGIIRGEPGFKKRKYAGSNPHNVHVHVSVKHSLAGERGQAWALGAAGKPAKPSNPSKRAKPTRENKSIQTALKRMGLYSGKIDGRNEAWQIAAVKAFQSWHGLVPDGTWGPKTQAVFTLNKRVQQALIGQGYTKQTIDGYYGDQTAANVRDFQHRTGRVVDGIAGPDTLKGLGL